MKQTLEESAREYYERNKIHISKDLFRPRVIDIFRAGAEWAEKNKEKPKAMCLRDKTKICDLCHECDVYVLNPNY